MNDLKEILIDLTKKEIPEETKKDDLDELDKYLKELSDEGIKWINMNFGKT